MKDNSGIPNDIPMVTTVKYSIGKNSIDKLSVDKKSKDKNDEKLSKGNKFNWYSVIVNFISFMFLSNNLII